MHTSSLAVYGGMMRFLFRKMAREMKSSKAPGSDLGLESSIKGL